jgi:predicted nucleic acid-binding protein
VLDWLVFADVSTAHLASAITSGRVRWLATRAMRDEFEQVLARGSLDAWRPDAARAAQVWERWATSVAPPPGPSLAALRCTDPDDQMFIDLAMHAGAAALLSRDRAVLRLARRARGFGLAILPPCAWAG